VWLEFIPEKPLFKIVNYETASRDGKPFTDLIKKRNYLPNATQRFCTGDLKIKTSRRYVRSLKHRGHFENLLGLRFDEPTRVAKKKEQNDQGKEPEFNVMPLHEMRITKEQVSNFWANQPFDLQIPSRLGNCDLCFMKGESNIIWTIRENPELADWWMDVEKHAAQSAKRKRNGQFNKKWSYATLKHIAKTQTYIPLPIDDGATVNCSCTD
jgi:3'-phosphoadenosine 5'-phosphosulfate sulfotransferase (PAPS reductase)/FAD synthetase